MDQPKSQKRRNECNIDRFPYYVYNDNSDMITDCYDAGDWGIASDHMLSIDRYRCIYACGRIRHSVWG